MEEAIMYLDKIPKGTHYHEIRRLLHNNQGVRRIFLSNKRRKSLFAFGFVEFYTSFQMKRVVREMDGKIIRGWPIIARPTYKPKPKGIFKEKLVISGRGLMGPDVREENQLHGRDLREWIEHERRKMVHFQKDANRRHEQVSELKLSVKPSQEWRRKLLKGIVIELKNPMEVSEIKGEVNAFWENWEEILSLSKRKYLVVFRKEYDCAVARAKLSQRREEMPFFTSWCRNKKHIQNAERLAWIEMVGLPLLAWERQNIYKIAEIFEKPVKIVMGEEIGNFAMEVGVLIKTKEQSRLDQSVTLSFGDGDEYLINVIERCMGKRLEKEDFVEDILRRQGTILGNDWPNVSMVYSSNHELCSHHDKNGGEQATLRRSPKNLRSFAEAVRGDEVGDQVRSLQNNGLNSNHHLETVQESSSAQSIDLNRRPNGLQMLDLDPNTCRSEHVSETQNGNNHDENAEEQVMFNNGSNREDDQVLDGDRLELISRAEEGVELTRLVNLQIE